MNNLTAPGRPCDIRQTTIFIENCENNTHQISVARLIGS
jgi:hypothetical protein